jgi:hypothetical protein
MKITKFTCLVLACAWMWTACNEDAGLKGTLILSITDAPIDAASIKGVNLVFLNVEARRNGDWRSLKTFDQPIGVNLLEYAAGKSFQLIDQYVDPGTITEFRITLNIADPSESLIKNPQSNITFTNGSSKPLYLPAGMDHQVIIKREVGISTSAKTDITLDFDVRKSISLDEQGNYVLDPVIRFVETQDTGLITAEMTQPTDLRLVVFAYQKGKYSSSETTASAGEVAFKNATTSARIRDKKFGLGFLEEGAYDLVFVKVNENGSYSEVIGFSKDISVVAGEESQLQIDVSELSPS